MKLYVVSNDSFMNVDIVLHNGQSLTVRGRGKTRLPDCSLEKARVFYKKLARYGLSLHVDCSDEVDEAKKSVSPDTLNKENQESAEKPQQEENKEQVETPPEAPAQEPATETTASEQQTVVESKADLMKKTKPQLMAQAKEMGIEEDLSTQSKQQIVERILSGK